MDGESDFDIVIMILPVLFSKEGGKKPGGRKGGEGNKNNNKASIPNQLCKAE